jgi:hypothetical protein
MTRINVVPVEELCDQHLLAEHRELTRIPNGLLSGRLSLTYHDRPSHYTLGAGHVKFFTDKIGYLWLRYLQLHSEAVCRGFNVTDRWPMDARNIPEGLWNYYKPTPEALALNRARIRERMPIHPRFTNKRG